MADGKVELFEAAVCGREGVQMFEADQAAVKLGQMAGPQATVEMSAPASIIEMVKQACIQLDIAVDDMKRAGVPASLVGYGQRAYALSKLCLEGLRSTNLSGPQDPALFAEDTVGRQENISRQEKEVETQETDETSEACSGAKPKKMAAADDHRKAQDEEIAKVSEAEKKGPKEKADALEAAKERLRGTAHAITKERVEHAAAETLAAMTNPGKTVSMT